MCSKVPSPSVQLLELQRSQMMPGMNDHRPSDVLYQDLRRNTAESKQVEGRRRCWLRVEH